MAVPGIFVVAGVTVATVSPQARAALRRGVVYGLASVMNAGEALAHAAQSAGDGRSEPPRQSAENSDR